jgi:sterol desaturase/sphingolipid hydroxylase (fatty acid hydroxylase superfamily)
MDERDFQLARAGAFVAAMGLAVLLQRLVPHARLRGSWVVNGGLWVLNGVVLGLVCGTCAFSVADWAAQAHVGLLHWAAAPAWLATIGSIVVLDLVSYGWHRANHGVAALWRFHQVHHSDPSFTTSTGLRFHPGELLLSLPIRLCAVVLLGAPAVAVLAFEVVFTVANLVEHGDIDLPLRGERILERVCVTPALHRRHHTRVGPARDTNFGTIFSGWDRLFGTFTPNDSSALVDTGLPGLSHVTLGEALVLPAQVRQ